MLKKKISKTRWFKFLGVLALVFGCAGLAFAGTASTQTIGTISDKITGSFQSVGKLMVAIAYLAGFGFTIAAIFKFKQHKDNPTQIPIGTPIALLIIGIALIFIPGLIQIGGGTIGMEEGAAGGFKGSGVEVVPGGTEGGSGGGTP